jgi:membrane associated rhomboid family serine protease
MRFLRRLIGLHPDSNRFTLRYLAKNMSIVIGLVLVWRGVWYVLDGIDAWLFGGHHIWTAVGGIILGLLVLYLPDRDLKEISKL